MNIENVAKVCHEVNRAYCQALGDDSQIVWESAPDWQKNSYRNGPKGKSVPKRCLDHLDDEWVPEDTALIEIMR